MATARVRCCQATFMVVFIIIMGAMVAVAVFMHFKERSSSKSRPPPPLGGDHEPCETTTCACRATPYPEVCVSDLMAFAPGAADAQLVPMSINASRRHVLDALSDLQQMTIIAVAAHGSRAVAAYQDCVELLDAAADLLEQSVDAMTTPAADSDTTTMTTGSNSTSRVDEDVATWLSAALTYHDTCNDSIHEVDDDDSIKQQMLEHLSRSNLGKHLSNSLTISASMHNLGQPTTTEEEEGEETPAWVKDSDHRLLQVGGADIVPDIVVAADGSGTYRTISGAIDAAPVLSRRRVVIYVKAGVYSENVVVPRNKTNLMLLGDGANRTVLVGHRNFRDDNVTTFRTATLTVSGAGFIMRDMTVENRAGPEKSQAVALLVSADRAVVYRCAVLGYQDTLYAHAHRQLYRDCDVAGTVDFVAGNAAVVLQNCTLWARRPLPRQKNTVTAQGRRHAHQHTGISVHRCRLLPSPELAPVRSEYPTYLGRPWKPYARVVYMMSSMADHVHAAGWLAWDASPNDAAPDTVYFGEYSNTGAGAALTGRVAWPGHHVLTRPEEAMEFTVGRLIDGPTWLPPTGVPFVAGLTE